MDDFPKIKTNRLILRRVTYKDIPSIVEFAGDELVAKTTLNIPHPYTEKDAIFWINTANEGFENDTQYTFAIVTVANDQFIGAVGLKINRRFNRAELGYWIAVPLWNMGYASEAVQAILIFGFNDMKLNKIHATHLVENTASGKVMLKNGMIKEGVLKEHVKKAGLYQSLVQYRLTREEFDAAIPSHDLNQD